MIIPNWPAPTWVRALTTTRHENNLALRDGACPEQVHFNRLRLQQNLNLRHDPFWLNQTHSTVVLKAHTSQFIPQGMPLEGVNADGAWANEPDLCCAVLTADCLPLLLCDEKGTVVSAVHAGWRGMLNGIIENAVGSISPMAQGAIMVWLGPAIGPLCFEVGPEVREQFIQKSPQFAYAFKPTGRENKWLGDLYQLARLHLRELGVSGVYGGEHCTFTQTEQFYSFRREKVTGRIATLIWLNNR